MLIDLLFWCCEFISQLTEPFVGSINLFFWLKFAIENVSLSPLGETFCDLLDTTDWVGFVVSWASSSFTVKEGKVIILTSFSWSTVFVGFIIVSAKFESSFESSSVSIEFSYPVSSSFFIQISVTPFSSEFVQLGQTLKWVSWWDLLVLCRSNGNNGSGGEFHFLL